MSSHNENSMRATSTGSSAWRSPSGGQLHSPMAGSSLVESAATPEKLQAGSPVSSAHVTELLRHYADGEVNEKEEQAESATSLAGSKDGKKGGGGSPGVPSKKITMKRKNIHLGAADKYGHWWTELDGVESYGWWPKYPVGLKSTLFGTEGELNGVTSFGGTATRDPHHGDGTDQEFQPVIIDPAKSEDTAKAEIRSFANSYSGEWRWTFGAGQNCHTFQTSMMRRSRPQGILIAGPGFGTAEVITLHGAAFPRRHGTTMTYFFVVFFCLLKQDMLTENLKLLTLLLRQRFANFRR